MVGTEDAADHIPKNPLLCDSCLVLLVLLLVLIAVQSGVHHTFGGGYGRKKTVVNKYSFDGPDDGFQINQNWIRKKIDEVEEDDDKTFAISTEHQGLKTRLKDNKVF